MGSGLVMMGSALVGPDHSLPLVPQPTGAHKINALCRSPVRMSRPDTREYTKSGGRIAQAVGVRRLSSTAVLSALSALVGRCAHRRRFVAVL